MADENDGALRTPLGRERLLGEHEQRIDGIDRRVTDMEQKEKRRDKRWDLVVRSLLAIGTGIIIAVASALIASGVHP
jgi:hypothetical protein